MNILLFGDSELDDQQAELWARAGHSVVLQDSKHSNVWTLIYSSLFRVGSQFDVSITFSRRTRDHLLGWVVSKLRRIPMVVVVSPGSPDWGFFDKFVLRNCQLLISPTQAEKARLVAHGVPNRNISIVACSEESSESEDIMSSARSYLQKLRAVCESHS